MLFTPDALAEAVVLLIVTAMIMVVIIAIFRPARLKELLAVVRVIALALIGRRASDRKPDPPDDPPPPTYPAQK